MTRHERSNEKNLDFHQSRQSDGHNRIISDFSSNTSKFITSTDKRLCVTNQSPTIPKQKDSNIQTKILEYNVSKSYDDTRDDRYEDDDDDKEVKAINENDIMSVKQQQCHFVTSGRSNPAIPTLEIVNHPPDFDLFKATNTSTNTATTTYRGGDAPTID